MMSLRRPGLARPQPEPAPPASGNSGNSGNFLAGSARENRNFCETDAAPPGGSGHKDAIDALRRLKNAGATVTWDGRESRVSFEAVSGADQASLECYRKAAVKVDAYLAAELPEFTPAEQRRAERLVHDLAVEVVVPSNPGHAGTLIAELIALSGDIRPRARHRDGQLASLGRGPPSAYFKGGWFSRQQTASVCAGSGA